jgi:hypothetical protein
MSITMAVLIIVFFAAGLVTFVCYERLLKRQYATAREVWEADDRPPGFLWAAEGTSVMRSWTRSCAYFRWLASTPTWIQADAEAQRAQRGLRAAWLFALAACLGLVLIAVSKT